MLRTLSITLLLTGCTFWSSEPVYEAGCACTFTPAPGMWRDDEVALDAVMGFYNPFTQDHAAVEFVPIATTAPQSLAAWMHNMSMADPPSTVLDKPVYISISGRSAVYQDMLDSIDGEERVTRYVVVDNGKGTVHLQMGTKKTRWKDGLAKVDAMIASLTLDPAGEEVLYDDANEVHLKNTPLLAERKAHTTQVKAGDGPLEPHMPPPESAFEVVKYTTEAGELLAYLSKDPGDGKKHPAVLWVEGGFGGPSSVLWTPQEPKNDQSALVFQQAGIVVMAPSFRGELDNPGRAEHWYGETDDLLKAVQDLKEVPWVDPDRVYLAGHSTGGTHVLLAAVASDQFRAAFVFAGRADLAGVAAEGGYDEQVFDANDANEVRLRSAIHWVKHIKRPVYYFTGDDDYGTDGVNMAKLAKNAGVPMQAHIVPFADHFSLLTPAKRLVAQQILVDNGPEAAFAFPESELYKAALTKAPAEP